MRVLIWQAFDVGDSDIPAYRAVTVFDADRQARRGLPHQSVSGVSGRAGGKANGRIEIARVGVAGIEYGDVVTRGDLLVPDAAGRGVPFDTRDHFRQVVLDGAAANTDIEVDGLGGARPSVIELASGYADRTAAIVSRNGPDIRLNVDTTGDRLLVTLHRQVWAVGIADVSGVAGDIGEVLLAPGLA